jgi:uncharacterized protein (TIGR03067 family)
MTLTRRGAAVAALFAVSASAGLGLLASPVCTAQEKGKGALEGTWTAIALNDNGKEFGEAAKIIRLTFSGDKAELRFPGETLKGTFKTNAAKEPKQIDIRWEKEGRFTGIYRLEKDKLTCCFSEGDRPDRFESRPGKYRILFVLKRGEIKLTAAEEKRFREKFKLETQKTISSNNLKQLALALHNWHDVYKRLPGPAITDKADKPLLSWRVALLPYIEQKNLYDQFKLDEPWDSAHNIKLLEKMPQIYAPVRGKTKEPHSTYYQVFVGPGTAFEPGQKLTLRTIPDGTSNTIFAVEAGEAVPWTKPADIPFDPKKALPKLGGLFPDGFHIVLLDGYTRWVGRNFDERILRLAITRNDGQKIDLDKLSK